MAFSIAENHLGIPSLLDPQDMLESVQLDKLSILTYVSQFYHKFSKESPTPAARRSILPGSSKSDPSYIEMEKDNSVKDDENKNTAIDLSELPPVNTYSSPDNEGDLSSSSPYSSSSSSGCYQLPTASDWPNADQSSFSRFKVSSLNLSKVTAGKAEDATLTECSHKSSKSTNISESLATHWNARKLQPDQTFTNFTDRPSSGSSIFNDRQMPVISPTPSSSSSKASIANELMFITNTQNDSGLEQSSEMSSTSSPSSSRLSSVSPSSEKMNRNLVLPIIKKPKTSVQRKVPKKTANTSSEFLKENQNVNNKQMNQMKKDRPANNGTISDVVNVKVRSKIHEPAELITNNQATFKATLTKFNSLSVVSGQHKTKPHRSPASNDTTVKLKSQSSQTEELLAPPTQLVSQLCQTEESHLSCATDANIRYQRLEHADPVQRYKKCSAQDIRRNTLLRQMTGTNMFYNSIYSPQPDYSRYRSKNSENLPFIAGVQSTLV